MSVAEWVDTYGIHHWRILWSSYRKLVWVGFEPTTTEFRIYYLVFLTFNYNLLALNQLLTFVSSSFIFSNKTLMLVCMKKRFLSSTNMIEFTLFETWFESFTYNRNNKGPKRDPWRIPHVTVAFLVELCPKEITCFRPFE